MKVKIRYIWDEERKIKRVIGYMVARSGHSFADHGPNEIVVEECKLPKDFVYRYYLYEVRDNIVLWNAELYEAHKAKEYQNRFDHIHPE